MPSKSKKNTRKPSRQKTEQCAGCELWFTINGYFHHLRQTQKPSCIAVRDTETRYHPSHSSVDSTSSRHSASPTPSPHSSDNDNHIPRAETQAFRGDYFGEYAPEDFNDYDEYDAGADVDEVEDGEHGLDGAGEVQEDDEDHGGEEDAEEAVEEEDALNYQEEGSWEPPVRDEDDIDNDLEEEASELADETAPSGTSNIRAAQKRTQEQLRAKTYVVRFPDPHAASPSSAKGSSAYQNYQAAVDPEGENPYHPFTTRLDWEIAHWAKMRGPGSTALTELLAIKEVSLRRCIHPVFELKFNSSSW